MITEHALCSDIQHQLKARFTNHINEQKIDSLKTFNNQLWNILRAFQEKIEDLEKHDGAVKDNIQDMLRGCLHEMWKKQQEWADLYESMCQTFSNGILEIKEKQEEQKSQQDEAIQKEAKEALDVDRSLDIDRLRHEYHRPSLEWTDEDLRRPSKPQEKPKEVHRHRW